MSHVKRFYIINNDSLDVVRGWRAHRLEQRWFYVIRGCFVIDLVKIDDWIKPSRDLSVNRVTIHSNSQELVHVPMGFGAALVDIEGDSELLVFADSGIVDQSQDDYQWPIDYFVNRIK